MCEEAVDDVEVHHGNLQALGQGEHSVGGGKVEVVDGAWGGMLV